METEYIYPKDDFATKIRPVEKDINSFYCVYKCMECFTYRTCVKGMICCGEVSRFTDVYFSAGADTIDKAKCEDCVKKAPTAYVDYFDRSTNYADSSFSE